MGLPHAGVVLPPLVPLRLPGDPRVKTVGRDEGKPQSTTDAVVRSVDLAF